MSAVEVRVPDLEDFDTVEVIEVLVQPGDKVAAGDSLVTVESDKAAMEIPGETDGVIERLAVKLGDQVAEGDLIAVIADAAGAEAGDDAETTQLTQSSAAPPEESSAAADAPDLAESSPSLAEPQPSLADPPPAATEQPSAPATARPAPAAQPSGAAAARDAAKPHAGPAARHLARELGVDLGAVAGGGHKGRIRVEDVRAAVNAAHASTPPAQRGKPLPDFSRFGPVEEVEMSRINKLSAARMKQSWDEIPHVTHHDEVDITDINTHRERLQRALEPKRVKLTLLPFLIKALGETLRDFPKFCCSLDAARDTLILKQYRHIAVAVDTPGGLVAPVIRDIDNLDVFDLAAAVAALADRARNGRLRPHEIAGACMTITNLGGLGGTAFTPLINPPEVAILGVSRARVAPVWDGAAFMPRTLLPLHLSYDHRVNNGGDAARFMAHFARTLCNPDNFPPPP